MTLEPKVNGNNFPRRFHDRPSAIPRTHFLELRCKHYPTNVQLVLFILGWQKALENFRNQNSEHVGFVCKRRLS